MKKVSPRGRTSLRARVFRLLRMNRGFDEPSDSQEKTAHAGILGKNHCNYLSEIETAWFEAERKRAKALMEWQKRRIIC